MPIEPYIAQLKYVIRASISILTKLTLLLNIEPRSFLSLLVLVTFDFRKVLVEDALNIVKQILKIVFDIVLELLLLLRGNLSLLLFLLAR